MDNEKLDNLFKLLHNKSSVALFKKMWSGMNVSNQEIIYYTMKTVRYFIDRDIKDYDKLVDAYGKWKDVPHDLNYNFKYNSDRYYYNSSFGTLFNHIIYQGMFISPEDSCIYIKSTDNDRHILKKWVITKSINTVSSFVSYNIVDDIYTGYEEIKGKSPLPVIDITDEPQLNKLKKLSTYYRDDLTLLNKDVRHYMVITPTLLLLLRAIEKRNKDKSSVVTGFPNHLKKINAKSKYDRQSNKREAEEFITEYTETVKK